ncbi:MAG: 50S ribosomal protein L17 [Aquificota bacterium]|jgi:large subunit ribosomal protein L17|uniref:Large ribosomal subunit protein bL17 n=1 Tax=Hydrogenobacter sp. TaxID=2152829 RepID=A0A7C2V4Q1_9AQUI|nr:50S ribosomal protein L17 [Aquificaceae bacterium]MDM7267403.1 50S ribosomal protein L17 [Aquificaceae bacterium]QWK12972.1 MAG: 50S ribosomal protein L17 [Aquificota bacterium]HAV39697.1 50S ribosomal protein L17 [Aquificaceae bacterium]
MRHKVKKKHFDRTKEQRLALYRSLARAIIMEERIETSLQKAKAVKPFVERLITLGKKGDLTARRLALQLLPDKKAIRKLFEEIAPRFENRNGGYTRIIKLPDRRKGDGCELAILELVE